ncbi:hypothetical protein [Bombilactobacillus bombi]|uniref:hypothetical protein n=1 Tax=Bombilactobacillus bombi TaxID=1303590 RepID=UPI0015E5F60B|nr:hypothetical protein [Bombilactobacillus bombi]
MTANKDDDITASRRLQRSKQSDLTIQDQSKHLQHWLDKAILVVVVLIIITYLILFLV